VSEQEDFKYDVAISFLGDDLQLAEELANLLRDRMSVFLFTERQGEIAGSDGLDTLSLVFGSHARLVVILHRATWGSTPWTRVEETAIKNRGLQSGWDFILLIPLEQKPALPPWLPKTQIWLSYAQYGLTAAVPVLERKLEELGGVAKPVTAQTRAEQFKRHTVWKEKAGQLRRSPEGVEAANRHVEELFAELESASAKSGGLQFKTKTARAARMWSNLPEGEGSTVTFYWSMQWANSLDQSGLSVRLWQGYAPAAGEGVIAFDEPVEIQEDRFDFVYSEAGKWMWEHRDTKRDYDTGQLASHCIGLLLDHIAAD
jgi:hypothetical protein